MKKSLWVLLFLFSITTWSQSIELANWASGRLVGFGAIYPDSGNLCPICIEKESDLYGYYQIIDKGEIRDGISKFEYILFDNNLNPYANQEFEDLKFNKSLFFSNLNGYKIFNYQGKLRMARMQIGAFLSFVHYYRDLDDKTNTLSDPYFMNLKDQSKSESFKITNKDEILKLSKKYFKDKPEETQIEELFTKLGTLTLTKTDKKGKDKGSYFLRLSDNDTQLMEKEFKITSDSYKINIAKVDEKSNTALLLKSENPKSKTQNNAVQFLVLDLTNGNISKTLDYSALQTSNKKDIYNVTKIKSHNNIIFQAQTIEDKKNNYGFILSLVDISDLKNPILKKKNFEFKDLKFLNVTDKNKVKSDGQKNHFVNLVEYFFKEDGNILVLFKENYIGQVKKGQYIFHLDYLYDYHFAEFDQNLNFVKHHKVTNQEFGKKGAPIEYLSELYTDNGITFATLWLDQKKPVARENLFAQPDFNYQNITFFNFNNGQINSSTLPLKRQGTKIKVMNAKKGYILIREYSDNGMVDEVRLEKLAF